MSPEGRTTPRTFYLNERHELARAEKKSGGGIPKYTDINWAARGTAISRSLNHVRRQVQRSPDPSKASHYFVLAAPVESLAKTSTNKRRAVDGKVSEDTDFACEHSQIFRRLGLDLLSVEEDGSAMVHMKPEILEQLSSRAQSLQNLGAREQSRWATIDRFELIPPKFRIDADWLETLGAGKITDAVIEFQPLLLRSEIDKLIRVIVSMLLRNLGEAVTGTGTDFSGRQWVRGKITPEGLTRISRDFFAIQSLHSPLISRAASSPPSKSGSRATPNMEVDISNLPTIAVVDTGVPADHSILARYRRGAYTAPTSTLVPADDHGCFVSSRVVFGDLDYSAGPPKRTPAGSACYYDINVSGIGPGDIDDKSVYPALQAIVSTASDCRVFNMSFDTDRPLDLISSVKRSECLNLVQDLDNFIFQNDALVIVAAGNSTQGLIPSADYPRHFDDPQWGLGSWARSFNSLTCGSFVERLSIGGLVSQVRWPSPFCRVGPGLCDSPKPDFSANGGNATSAYQYGPGLGVWGLVHNGMWEDRAGTSFAAPLLAREAAFALQRLQLVCEQGAQPFAVTAKAFLCLTAIPAISDNAVKELAERTLGRGLATAGRLEVPSAGSGVMIWQGVLEDEKDIARIQIPIPTDWLNEADEPHLKLIVVWDPPVNAAVKHLWATRRISAKLRMHPEARAQRTSALKSHRSYPFLERLYDLNKLPKGFAVEGDVWLIEISYDQIAAYHSAMTFPPQQRVAFAAELFDAGEKKLSPQRSLQSLSSTKTMNRLTLPPAAARLPVLLRTPL
jgi:hypothetical protein